MKSLAYPVCLFFVSGLTLSFDSLCQVPVSASLSCDSFSEWNQAVVDSLLPKSRVRTQGRSAEIPLISEEGFHPTLKASYQIQVRGRLVLQGERLTAGFRMEALTTDHKPLIHRDFLGRRTKWTEGNWEKDVDYGQKTLLWAGGRGPTPEMLLKFPQWVDVSVGTGTGALQALVVPGATEALSDQGTLYYFPEGILEIFTRKAPLKEMPLRRLYLWAGGCTQDSYPSPWPRVAPKPTAPTPPDADATKAGLPKSK